MEFSDNIIETYLGQGGTEEDMEKFAAIAFEMGYLLDEDACHFYEAETLQPMSENEWQYILCKAFSE